MTLSNPEMKHVGEFAITVVLLKAFKTSRVRTTQGSAYLTKCRLFRLLLLHTYNKLICPE